MSEAVWRGFTKDQLYKQSLELDQMLKNHKEGDQLLAPVSLVMEYTNVRAKRKIVELEHKYPNAKTDNFQKTCFIFELQQTDRTLLFIKPPTKDMVDTVAAMLHEAFGLIEGTLLGIGSQKFGDAPEGTPGEIPNMVGLFCYEDWKDYAERKLHKIGLGDWLIGGPDQSPKETFEAWKKENEPK